MHGMYQGKKILIACSMIEDEINAVFDHFGCGDIEVRWMERGYHNDPDELREVIQNEINRAEADGAGTVILAYGFCGKGASGWRTKKAVLAMPRFDDCCNMMLCTGKRQKRNLLEAGNMYLTKGWSKDEGALLSMLERAAEKCADLLGLELATVPGGNEILRKLITGDWDEDIIVKKPGEPVSDEDFEFGGETGSVSDQLWRKTL